MKEKLGYIKNHYLRLHKLKKYVWSIIRAILVMGICFTVLLPLFSRISNSFMLEEELYDITVNFIPKNFTLEPLRKLWVALDYPKRLMNSLLFSFASSVLQIASCMLVGYSFARFKFKGSKILFAMVIVTMIIPPQAIMMPLYVKFKYFNFFGLSSSNINLIGTFWPFALLGITCMNYKNGLYIYMFRQFFRNMPKELEEASYIDGAGTFKTFYRIMMPSAVPIMITTFIFAFVWQYNDSQYANFLYGKGLLSTAIGTVGSTIATQENRLQDWNYVDYLTNPAVLLHMIPLIIVYVLLQRYIKEGIQRSGIVG